MSIIPPKERTMPGIAFYSLGQYPHKTKPERFTKQLVSTGGVAEVDKRNPHVNEDLDIKPITQKKPSLTHYEKKAYLTNFQGVKDDKQIPQKFMKNPHLNMVQKKKDQIKERANIKVESGKRIVNGSEFEKKKTFGSEKPQSTDKQRSGYKVNDNYMYVTKQEQLYRDTQVKEKKINLKSMTSKDAPEWFKILEKPNNRKTVADMPNFDGTITIVSKMQNWITVYPKEKIDRKHPLEIYGRNKDLSKTSKLVPGFMQIDASNPGNDKFKKTVPLAAIRKEANRTFLIDRDQPKKNVFSYMDTRHNIGTQEMAKAGNKGAERGVPRLYGWNENIKNQTFDKPIAPKIGSLHEQHIDPKLGTKIA